jgi:hypothetical protein
MCRTMAHVTDQPRRKRNHHRDGQTHRQHDHANDHQYSRDQDIYKSENYPPPSYLSDLLNNSSLYIQERIQMQEEEMRARNAQEQARIQIRLAKGPRDLSPRED